MRKLVSGGSRWKWGRAALVVLTLVTSAVHFADNAFHLELYPGPVWLTRDVVLGAWLVVLAAALLAYRAGTRTALAAYGTLGFAGLAHYAVPHRMGLSLRCTVTIGAEAAASLMLIAYVLLEVRRQKFSSVRSPRAL